MLIKKSNIIEIIHKIFLCYLKNKNRVIQH